jgi:hypothetical protein
MARRYPPAVEDTVYALMAAGLNPGEIRARLAHGTNGLPPVAVPARTLREIRARLRRDRGDPQEHVEIKPGDELTTADAIARRLLVLLDAQVRRLESASHARPLTPTELGQLERATRVALDTRRRLADESRPKSPGHKRASDPTAPRRPTLADLADLERAAAATESRPSRDVEQE